jgi:hypothetical protein
MMGVAGRLKKGLPLNNRPPYGYSKAKDGSYIINPDEVHWVKKIFEWYSKGITLGKIREQLINNGAVQRSANHKIPWNLSVIKNILAYEGYWTGSTSVKWDEEVYNIPTPILIDSKTIKECKARKEKFVKYPAGNLKADLLFAGLVYCEACKVKMQIISMTNGYIKKGATEPKKLIYYRCPNFNASMQIEGCCKSVNAQNARTGYCY